MEEKLKQTNKQAWIWTDTFIIYHIWYVSLRVWLHVFCKISLNKTEICLIGCTQLQCLRDTQVGCLDPLRIKRKKRAFLDLFLTSSSGQDKLTTLLGYNGNLDNYLRCRHLQLHFRSLHLAIQSSQQNPKDQKASLFSSLAKFTLSIAYFNHYSFS